MVKKFSVQSAVYLKTYEQDAPTSSIMTSCTVFETPFNLLSKTDILRYVIKEHTFPKRNMSSSLEISPLLTVSVLRRGSELTCTTSYPSSLRCLCLVASLPSSCRWLPVNLRCPSMHSATLATRRPTLSSRAVYWAGLHAPPTNIVIELPDHRR